jgi:hypothetical protein
MFYPFRITHNNSLEIACIVTVWRTEYDAFYSHGW